MCFQRDALGLDIPETVPHVACAVVVDASGPHARSIAEHSTNSIKRTNKLLASNDVARRRVEFAVIEAAGNVGFLSCFSPLRRHLRVTVRSGGSSCVEEGMSLAHVAIHELMADWESKCYVCRRPVIFVVSDAEFCKDDDESGDDGKFYCESGLLCPYMVSVGT